jgi:16S rRNA (guanine966-N2)-methyltransferase
MVEADAEDLLASPVLDLFAGSGAAGIEALSRGAPLAVFVERDGRAIAVIGRNLERTGLAGRGRVLRRDVLAFLVAAPPPEAPFGLVVVDPPYAQVTDVGLALEQLADPARSWLAEQGMVVAKHFWKDDLPARVGELDRRRQRRFGETALSVYRRGGASIEDAPAAGGDA